jgi:hypothetical protein
MGSYGSGRKAEYELTERYHTVNVESARCFGYRIVYTEQKNVAGKRPWIICPICQRRCAKLYFRLKDIPLCRECLHLNYASQRQPYEEKQRTYERYLLLEGCYEEWKRRTVRYLSEEEAAYHYHKWNIKMMRELMKLFVETMKVYAQVLPDEKQSEIEAKILQFEKKEEPTNEDIARAHHEIELLMELAA